MEEITRAEYNRRVNYIKNSYTSHWKYANLQNRKNRYRHDIDVLTRGQNLLGIIIAYCERNTEKLSEIKTKFGQIKNFVESTKIEGFNEFFDIDEVIGTNGLISSFSDKGTEIITQLNRHGSSLDHAKQQAIQYIHDIDTYDFPALYDELVNQKIAILDQNVRIID